MAWRIEVTPAAAKELRKVDRQVARRIGAYLQDLVVSCGDPRQRGKGLTANWAGLWRYRVGDHRVICQLEDDRLLVLVVRIVHRSEAASKRLSIDEWFRPPCGGAPEAVHPG